MKVKREVLKLVYNINMLAFESLIFFLLQRQEFSHSQLANLLSYNSIVSSKLYINAVQILGGHGEGFYSKIEKYVRLFYFN